jgi:hypothetical protein
MHTTLLAYVGTVAIVLPVFTAGTMHDSHWANVQNWHPLTGVPRTHGCLVPALVHGRKLSRACVLLACTLRAINISMGLCSSQPL